MEFYNYRADTEYMRSYQRNITATCGDCGFTGTMAQAEVHSCYVQEMGGRCEDYPCCGHTDGDGCQTRPEHTSAYWLDLAESFDDPADYDAYCDRMDSAYYY